MFKRVIVIVLDSVGIRDLLDTSKYGDAGANAIANIAHSQGGLFLPTLEKVGVGTIRQILGGKNLGYLLARLVKWRNIKRRRCGCWA